MVRVRSQHVLVSRLGTECVASLWNTRAGGESLAEGLQPSSTVRGWQQWPTRGCSGHCARWPAPGLCPLRPGRRGGRGGC